MDLTGQWRLRIEFLLGTATHSLQLTQAGAELTGRYRSGFGDQEIRGVVDAGGGVRLRSGVRYQACGAGYTFEGRVVGDGGQRLAGSLGLGEYWTARWEAERLT